MIKKIKNNLNDKKSYVSVKSFDTIVAQVTPISRSAVGILRVSGSKVILIAKKILGKIPEPRYATYIPFYSSKSIVIDYGIVIYFPKPNSFTGEDVIEFQCHGGMVVLNLLLKKILNINGVRIANPGEFCERAFLNNKFDLTQVEAISDLINADSEQAASFAIKSMQGVFSSSIYKMVEKLKNLCVELEYFINFSDEENICLDNIRNKFDELILDFKNIMLKTKRGVLIREGLKIVITGLPNAGKSSLLNILAGRDISIVTDIPGTTRDVLREYIYIDGIPVYIIDTAGLCSKPNNEVERIGINKAYDEIKKADRILYIVDSSTIKLSEEQFCFEFINTLPKNTHVTIIRNKIDISKEQPGIIENKNYQIICMSIRERIGIDLLYKHLKEIIRSNNNTEGLFLARRRHLDTLSSAFDYLLNAYKQLVMNNSIELLVEELRLAQNELNKITGNFTTNDLLNTIFSSFCIGK